MKTILSLMMVCLLGSICWAGDWTYYDDTDALITEYAEAFGSTGEPEKHNVDTESEALTYDAYSSDGSHTSLVDLNYCYSSYNDYPWNSYWEQISRVVGDIDVDGNGSTDEAWGYVRGITQGALYLEAGKDGDCFGSFFLKNVPDGCRVEDGFKFGAAFSVGSGGSYSTSWVDAVYDEDHNGGEWHVTGQVYDLTLGGFGDIDEWKSPTLMSAGLTYYFEHVVFDGEYGILVSYVGSSSVQKGWDYGTILDKRKFPEAKATVHLGKTIED